MLDWKDLRSNIMHWFGLVPYHDPCCPSRNQQLAPEYLRSQTASNGQLVKRSISNDSQTTLIYIYISLPLSTYIYIFQYTYSTYYYLFFNNILQYNPLKHLYLYIEYIKSCFPFETSEANEVSSSGWWEYATWPDPGSNPGSVSSHDGQSCWRWLMLYQFIVRLF